MKIPGSDGFIKDTISKTKAKELRKAESKKSNISGTKKTSTQEPSGEKIKVSFKAKEAAKINEIIKATPDIRTKKIELIKSQIDNGTYSVDGKKIAEKILNEILSENFFLENK